MPLASERAISCSRRMDLLKAAWAHRKRNWPPADRQSQVTQSKHAFTTIRHPPATYSKMV